MLVALLLLSATQMYSQQSLVKITGNVTDIKGEPLIGVTVVLKGNTSKGTMTDINGNYEISIPNGRSAIIFRYVGFVPKEEEIDNRKVINVVLLEDVGQLDEVVVVAYGTQKKESVVGSITTVAPESLKVGTSRSLSNNLAGVVSGVIGVQRSGEPGYDNSQFWIRGISSWQNGTTNPLVLVDGIERSLNNIDTEEIESFSVLKDAAASAVYGVRGANGVILINTKRGRVGKPQVVLKSEFALTQPVKLPKYVGAADYMQILDDILVDTGQKAKYTDRIAKTREGYDPDLYPDVNWMKTIANDYASNQRVTLDISGGSEILKYSFVAALYNERGILKRDPNKEWDPTIKLQRYNVRSNVDLKLTPTTLMRFNIGGYLQDRNATPKNISEIFSKTFLAVPHQFPPQYSSGEIPTTEEPNVWAWTTQSGYKRTNDSRIETLFSLEQDLKSVTPGLKIKGTFSFDRFSSGTVTRAMNPDYYNPATGRTEEGNLIIAKKTNGNNFLGYDKSADYGNRSVYMEASLYYNHLFAEKHAVSAMVMFNRRNYDPGDKVSYRTQGLAGRTSYTYNGKYIAEFNFGYNGSENFAKGKRYGFFPSGAIGWIVSEENFMKPMYDIISKLKLRASYGQVGNSGLSGRRFAYLGTILEAWGDLPYLYKWGEDGSFSRNAMAYGEFAVPDLTWEVVNKANLGMELGLFRGLIDMQIDYFDERRNDIFMARQSVPATAGFIKQPWSNYGKVTNKGVELSLNINKQLGKDLYIGAMGTFTYAHNKIVENDEPKAVIGTNRARTGHPVSQLFGHVAERLFTDDDFEDVSSGKLKAGIPIQEFSSKLRPGDIKYVDVNGDGKVNAYDEKAIGGTFNPEIVYGFGVNVRYKNFDFGSLFQGIGKTWNVLSRSIIPGFNRGVTGNIFTNADDRWTVDNPRQDVFYPRLDDGVNKNNSMASTWWLRNMSFLRLKNIELGYSFPKDLMRHMSINGARFFVRGSNLLTFSSFKLWDPEVSSDSGATYPIMKSMSVGFEIKF